MADAEDGDGLREVERDLFRAIRQAHQLDVEIDDELERLVSGERGEPDSPASGADDGGRL